MRRSSAARTSTCAGASSRLARGCATSPSRWSLTTTARRCEIGLHASLSTANQRPRCPFAMGSGIGYLASMVIATITGRRIASSLSTVETEPREVAVVAAHSLWSAALQLASAICRHYWPIATIGALLSRRCRQVVLVAAVVDGVVDWITRNGNADDDTKRVGLLTYILLKRLDDIAYGVGLWTGVVRERNVGAL